MTADTLRLENDDRPEVDFVLDSYKKNRTDKKATASTASVSPSPQRRRRTVFGFVAADIAWFNVTAFIYLHVSAACGIYLLVTGSVSLGAFVFGYIYGICSAIGVTGGAHRLWSHGAYKAKWPLRLILIAFQTAAFQNSIWEWVRDHRVHHKFTDTDADPHNFQRGFFFAHMGWLMVKKHPQVKEKGAGIDLSDIERDPICMFQKRYFMILMPLLAFIIPTYINMAVFGQSFWMALHCTNLRYMISLHFAWLVNSAAHCWGHKPFDNAIRPVNNWFLAMLIIGEGWHNYHHVFPWDYKAAEYGTYFLNVTTCFIDFFALFGWAYDLKSVAQPMVEQRAMRTGDGTFRQWSNGDTDGVASSIDHGGSMLWGWNDTDMPEQAKQLADIRNKSD